MITEMAKRVVDAMRVDGWANEVLGMGGRSDPSIFTTHVPRTMLTEALLEGLVLEDHFSRRIVSALPREAMRPGWDLEFGGDPGKVAEARSAYASREDELGVRAAMMEGAIWGRTFGGAITWIGADDGRAASRPLDLEAISTVRFLHTFARPQLRVWSHYTDPLHPKFRKPEIFEIRVQTSKAMGDLRRTPAPPSQGVLVHESRCIVWPGQPTTDERRVQQEGWDDSVLEVCWEALAQINENYKWLSLLLGKSSQGVFKIKNLYGLIAGKQGSALRTRMSMLDASRSRARSILLDTEEDFVNVAQPMGGAPELIDKTILRLAAAAEMPVAVLMGQPLSTFGGTGEGDIELWHQQAEAWRMHELRPRHEQITTMILLAKDGPTGGVEPDEWLIRYRPLRMPTGEQLANERYLQVQTDALRIDKGIATAEAIALARHAPAAGSDLVLDEAELRARLERRKELADQPPKDNAELGTVAPRDAGIEALQLTYYSRKIPREAALARLEVVYHYSREDAERLLAEPAEGELAGPVEEPATPGPDPEPEVGQGAGAPQGLPGVNDGGDPREVTE